jgi:hypothetical protein
MSAGTKRGEKGLLLLFFQIPFGNVFMGKGETELNHPDTVFRFIHENRNFSLLCGASPAIAGD